MPATAETVIPRRFRGPTGSGNGGWTSGLLAQHAGIDGPVQVTLRTPPPLERPLRVDLSAADVRLLDGDTVVAEARPGAVEREPGPVVSVERARAAEADYAGLRQHPFPECFVCGTDREPGDGMRLRPGPIAPGTTACTWVPDDVGLPSVWAALDCPGGWTSDIVGRPLVLGRMTVDVRAAVEPGQTYVVVGTEVGTTGRKTSTVTTLADATGTVLACAEQVWIAVDPGTFGA